jgi:hypothetical protein
MDLVRYSRNVYGQSVLEGASWDLLPWFAGIAVAIAVGHAVFMALKGLGARGARAR